MSPNPASAQTLHSSGNGQKPVSLRCPCSRCPDCRQGHGSPTGGPPCQLHLACLPSHSTVSPSSRGTTERHCGSETCSSPSEGFCALVIWVALLAESDSGSHFLHLSTAQLSSLFLPLKTEKTEMTQQKKKTPGGSNNEIPHSLCSGGTV